MKSYHVFGNVIDVNRFNNRISVQGDGGVTVLCFLLDRYVGAADLAEYQCVVKTRDAAGHSDAAFPQVETQERQLRVLWAVTRSTARAPGRLELQLEFHTRAGTEGENAFWQTRTAQFEVSDSLDAGAVFLQEPTVFQQWEQRIDEVYSQVASSIDRINEIRAEIEKLAGDAGLLEIDAKTLCGRRVDDSAAGADNLWTAQKTADEIGAKAVEIPLATPAESGLMPAADKEKLDGLDGLFADVDAKTLCGRTVDDGKADSTALWTAAKTAQAVADGAAAIPLATPAANGLMPAADKEKLDGLSTAAGVALEYKRDLAKGDYYKFSDGTLLCVRRMQISAAVDKQQGSSPDCWLSNTIQPGQFPHAFDTEPAIFTQLSDSRVWVLTDSMQTDTVWPGIQLCWSQKLTAAQGGLLYLLAIGRWK